MTDMLTAAQIAEQLQKLSKQLDDLVSTIAAAEAIAVGEREDYTLAYAKAFLRAEGAMDVRKQLAIVATHEERLDAEVAEATVRGLRRQIDSVKMRVDVGRSLGAALRAEIGLAGPGMAP